jgi:hypothetical protein
MINIVFYIDIDINININILNKNNETIVLQIGITWIKNIFY